MAVIRYQKEYVDKILGDYSILPELGVQVETEKDENKGVEEVEFEITPDRPDMLSIYGLRRLLDVYKTKKPRLYELESKKPYGEIIIDPSVKDIRPYIVGAVVKGVDISDDDLKDLMQFQEKIHTTYGRKRRKIAIGIHNLSVIEFPVTYRKDKLDRVVFTPLEETKKMTGEDVVNKTEKGKAYAHLTKDGEAVFVFDKKGVVSLPPIINADRTKLTPGKQDIFIDMTGTDLNALTKGLNMIVTILSEMGGRIEPVKVNGEIYPKLTYNKYNIPKKYIDMFIDKKLKDNEIKKLLMSMDWVVKGDYVCSQPYRTDIISEVDIAEDVLIAYGYKNITPEYPNLPTIGKQKKEHIFHKILTGLGFLEIKTWTLTNETKLKNANTTSKELIKILNPLSEEFTVFRPTLLPGILTVLNESKKVAMPHKIYELGVVAPPEREMLGVGMCYPGATFSHIRSIVQSLITETGVNAEIKEHDDNRFIPGRCAVVMINGKRYGVFGEIHPLIIERFGIEQPVLYFETELW
ncbi:phenylalanine--tRNA ligase subunit beta [Candidatus Micrarchaeota archaeon]|nr:phenylalanine--tRNA ligase subunit beta [Candidatus Micrarchaeota archaeon]